MIDPQTPAPGEDEVAPQPPRGDRTTRSAGRLEWAAVFATIVVMVLAVAPWNPIGLSGMVEDWDGDPKLAFPLLDVLEPSDSGGLTDPSASEEPEREGTAGSTGSGSADDPGTPLPGDDPSTSGPTATPTPGPGDPVAPTPGATPIVTPPSPLPSDVPVPSVPPSVAPSIPVPTERPTPIPSPTATPAPPPPSIAPPPPSDPPADTPAPEPSAAPTAECNDGIDNDGDGLTDWALFGPLFGGDAECSGPNDPSESS